MSKGGERPLDWDSLAPLLVHPLAVAILEAVEWIDQPLSASLIARMCEEERSVSEAAYRLCELADSGALELAYECLLPGSFERFYALSSVEHERAARAGRTIE
jgi:hypothetical protein